MGIDTEISPKIEQLKNKLKLRFYAELIYFSEYQYNVI